MPTKSGNYVYMEDGSTATQVYNANTPDPNSIAPVDIQSRLASTIQTHSGTVVAPSGTSNGNQSSSWIDTDGFATISATATNDAVISQNVTIQWSNDNANLHGEDKNIATGSNKYKAVNTTIKARYVRVLLENGDTGAPHTMNAWILLQA